MTDAELEAIVRRWLLDDPSVERAELLERLRRELPLEGRSSLARIVDRALDRALRHGAITDLLAQDGVTDICINGPGPVFVDTRGGLEPTGVEMSSEDLDVLIQRTLDPLGLRVDRSSPMVDGRLRDGSRINVVTEPLTRHGPVVTIRRFRSGSVPLHAFGPVDVVDILVELVESRANILVTGATGAGKTTLVNALARRVAPAERIIVIEDTAELRLDSSRAVQLEARPPNAEGAGAVTIRQLVRNALRMRPDRLIVGEVRGPEALDLLLALNSGHSGSLATCHGHGVTQCLDRLAVLAQLGEDTISGDAVAALVAHGLTHVVLVERVGAARTIAEVAVIDGPSSTAQLWSRAR